MIRVLFVCLGNICRSPMAEGVFQHMVNEAGLGDHFLIDSAGTSGYHNGEPAHSGTLRILSRHNIPYNGRSRRFSPRDADQFDYVLAMDSDNLRDMQRLVGGRRDNLTLFLSYANRAGLTDVREVPDPYYDGRFEEVYQLVTQGSRALLDHIRAEHGL